MSQSSARRRTMTQAEYEALRETLYSAAKTMSREQIIDLADSLFDLSRAQRELRSWRRPSPLSSHTG